MQKILVVILSVVSVCVLAKDKVLVNLDCATHFHLEGEQMGVKLETEWYIVTKKGNLGYQYLESKMSGMVVMTNVVRCDLADNNGKCLSITDSPIPGMGECEKEYDNGMVEFEYDHDEPTKCPDTAETDCTKYCSTEGGEETCLVLNSDKKLRQMINDGVPQTVTVVDEPFSLSVFAQKDCDGKTMAVPDDICSSASSIVKATLAVVIAAVVLALF